MMKIIIKFIKVRLMRLIISLVRLIPILWLFLNNTLRLMTILWWNITLRNIFLLTETVIWWVWIICIKILIFLFCWTYLDWTVISIEWNMTDNSVKFNCRSCWGLLLRRWKEDWIGRWIKGLLITYKWYFWIIAFVRLYFNLCIVIFSSIDF